MEQENKQKTGHCILTYRVRLYDRQYDWLQQTRDLYTKVVAHFFEVLTKEQDLLPLSDFLLLRALEEKCIGTKEMKEKGIPVLYPMVDFPKIPLYFRRSAINAAIALKRQCMLTTLWNEEETSCSFDTMKDREEKKLYESICANCAFTLYKGMYQNFTETSIELKLFTGEKWKWVMYPFFCSRPFPKEAKKMSPSLVLKSKEAWLNVPLSFEVSDIRTVKERMEQEERICAVSFPDYHVMAAAVILSKEGKVVEQQLFLGGKQREHQRKKILKQIKRSQGSRSNNNQPIKESLESIEVEKETVSIERENKHLYEKLHKINQYYVQNISRKIVTYCVERNIKVIVVPNYDESIDFSKRRYLHTDSYRWLGRSIIKKLKYKAFQQGIVVTSVKPYHSSDSCSECGAKIKKYNEGYRANERYFGGKLFVCPNGHKGNTAYNTAKNIGKIFLAYWT